MGTATLTSKGQLTLQSLAATRVISRLSREQPGFISAVVLAEIAWVLSRAYKASRDDVAKAVEGLLRSAELIVETAALAGARETVSFDRRAAAETGMRLLP